MKQFERRLRVLELAAGQVEDNSFCAQVARAHARGERVRRIIVDPRKGETIESVCEQEGITDDMPCIVRVIVDPGVPLPDPNELGLRPRLLKNVEIETGLK